MRKTLLYKKRIRNEEGREYLLCYSLVVHAAEGRRIYGVEVEKTDRLGWQERELLYGISERKEEAQAFIGKLWKGSALPTEIAALYDDFIGEKEWQGERGMFAAC